MSNYIGYNEIDNARRKANNVSGKTGKGPNRNSKRYTTSGMQIRDAGIEKLRKKYAKELKAREYTPEEIAAYMEEKRAA